MAPKGNPVRQVTRLSNPNDYGSRVVGSIMAGPPGQRIQAFQQSASPAVNKAAAQRNNVTRVVTGVDGRSPVITETTKPVRTLESENEAPLPSERLSNFMGTLEGMMDTAHYGVDIPIDIARWRWKMPKGAFKAGRFFGPLGSIAGTYENFADAETQVQKNRNSPNFDPTKAYTAAAISSLANAGLSTVPVFGTAYGLLDSQFDLSDKTGQWGADAIETDGRRIRENPMLGISYFPY